MRAWVFSLATYYLTTRYIIVKIKEVGWSNEEMADMHLAYGQANGNGREAVCLRREIYPSRRIQNPSTV